MDDRTAPAKIRMTGLQDVQLPALVELDRKCAEMYWQVGFDGAEVPVRSTADIAALTRAHNVHVAEADNQVAGYTAWRDEAPGVAYVAELSVHPDQQRFGIGSRLLDAVRADARTLNLEVATVRCWTKATWAMRFYEAAGFRPIDETAPEKVQVWAVEQSHVKPLTRPGEVALWAPIGHAATAAPWDDSETTY
jgi:amino-acid N-acetyltransferase